MNFKELFEKKLVKQISLSEGSDEYISAITDILNVVIKDELVAASLYVRLANKASTPYIIDHLLEHSQEEFYHYTKLIAFAHNNSLDIKVDFDVLAVNDIPTDEFAIIALNQQLEEKAINDYKNASIIARNNYDLSTEEFFTDLLKAEQEHFDDFVMFSGETRTL